MGNTSGGWATWPGQPASNTGAVQLPADWSPGEEVRTRAYQGDCILIRGSALAKANLIVREMGNCEAAWYWLAHRDDLLVIEDLYLPAQQTVSAAHVAISAEAVAAANRAVRRQGMVIVGGGHSHHGMGVSTSSIDVDLFGQLAQEGAGYRSVLWHSAAGCLSPIPASDEKQDADQPGEGRAEYRVTFDECPDTELLLSGPADWCPQDLELELKWRQTRLLSLFSTHDWWGKLHFPLLEVIRCGRCGERTSEQFLPPATMLIIGPIALDVEQRRQTLAELERHAPRRLFSAVTTGPSTSSTQTRAGGDSGQTAATGEQVAADSQTGGETPPGTPAPFEIYRLGEDTPVAVVEAAVIEEAAHRVPALGQALGWTAAAAEPAADDAPQSTPAGPAENPN